MNSFVKQKKGSLNMDNIVRSFEEIELTEAELDAIYGAQDAQGVSDLFDHSGTQVIFAGTTNVVTTSDIAGTVVKTIS
jgi:hypothetical protein